MSNNNNSSNSSSNISRNHSTPLSGGIPGSAHSLHNRHSHHPSPHGQIAQHHGSNNTTTTNNNALHLQQQQHQHQQQQVPPQQRRNNVIFGNSSNSSGPAIASRGGIAHNITTVTPSLPRHAASVVVASRSHVASVPQQHSSHVNSSAVASRVAMHSSNSSSVPQQPVMTSASRSLVATAPQTSVSNNTSRNHVHQHRHGTPISTPATSASSSMHRGNWSVPNPLLSSSTSAAPSRMQQSSRVQQQQQQQQPRKKVVLSPQARQALAKAIWSAITSPTGEVDPQAMDAAVRAGLPRHAILNAAQVAMEREALKKQRLAAERSANSRAAMAQRASALQQQSSSRLLSLQQQQQQQQRRQQQHLRQAVPVVHANPPQQQHVHQHHHRHQQQQVQQRHAPSHVQLQPTPRTLAGVSVPPSNSIGIRPAVSTAPIQQSRPQQIQKSHHVKPAPISSTLSSTPATVTTTSSTTAVVARTPGTSVPSTARYQWKRVHSGIFMVQKNRFLALPHSVSCTVPSDSSTQYMSSTNTLQLPPSLSMTEMKKIQNDLMKSSSNHATVSSTLLLDPESFRRIKLEPKRMAKALEKQWKKARTATQEALLKKLKDIHKSLQSHTTDFFKYHKSCRSELAKRARTIQGRQQKILQGKEKLESQQEQARWEALKAHDMEAYRALLENTKNDRLQYLWTKTDDCLKQISSLLQQQRSDSGDTTDDHLDAKDSKSYYAAAHLATEEVRQPSILVGGDLKEYQLAGLQWLVSLYNNKLNGILADEMGLGKTIQAISLVSYLMEFKENLGPYLIIVPLSTLSNWVNEFAKWCPSARVIVYKGPPAVRRELYKAEVRNGQFNVLLTTYEYIIKDKGSLKKMVWEYAIVDEGHRMKNAESKFAVTLSTVYQTKNRILLTGTPLQNNLREMWALLNFLLPSIFNTSESFDQWFHRPFASFNNNNNQKESTEEESDNMSNQMLSHEERMLIIHRLHELLRPFMLRRVKSEVLDQLPEKVEKVLRCELSSWQKELYRQISEKAKAEHKLDQRAVSQSQANAAMRGLNNVVMQLRKVCNHPFLFSHEGYHVNNDLISSSGKLYLLDQMLPKLRAAGHRVLMFTQMTAVMTILEDYFAYRGYACLRLDGSTPADERERRMYKFNAPDSPYFIFLLSTRAGGLGLNLATADVVVIFDSDWNPMMDLQAQDRAHRIGQRKDVSVFRLVTYSPVEEKILARANEKLNMSELVVEAGKFDKSSVEQDNSLERKKMMEVLLTDFDSNQREKQQLQNRQQGGGGSDDENDDESGDEGPQEDLNELFSNNEADYQLYCEMDKQYGERPKLYRSSVNVPDWIKYPAKGGAKAASHDWNDPIHNNARKRKAVAYDDGLTEKQFLRIMENQAIQDEASKAAAKKKRKTTKKKEKEVTAPSAAKSSMTEWTFRKLISSCKTIVALKDPVTKRRIADVFMEKPCAKTYPDYYQIIENPIAISDILQKCRQKRYLSLYDFWEDWKIMFRNAQQYNGKDSWVVQDAQALSNELERVMVKNGFDVAPPPQQPPPPQQQQEEEEQQQPAKPVRKKKKALRIKLSLKNVQK